MKSKMKQIFSVVMVLAMVVSLTACGEEITLESRTVNGVTLSVPGDFGEFAANGAVQMAADEDSTAGIAVSEKADAQGFTASDYDQDTYQQAYTTNYTDVTFETFDNSSELDGNSALYVKFNATTSNDVKLTIYSYIVFFEDGTCQSVALDYTVDADTSLETNIDSVLKSIKMS